MHQLHADAGVASKAKDSKNLDFCRAICQCGERKREMRIHEDQTYVGHCSDANHAMST